MANRHLLTRLVCWLIGHRWSWEYGSVRDSKGMPALLCHRCRRVSCPWEPYEGDA